MRQQQPRNWLMELAAKALKYFLLSLAGCTIAYVVSVVLEISFVSKAAVIFFGAHSSQGIYPGRVLGCRCCNF
jgi:hypothetical protein